MLTKSVLKKCGVVGLLAFGILWTQMPVKAQEESLKKQLAEAKAAITDQIWVIEQMKNNFFKVTGQLEAEIKRLRSINAEQARKVEEVTNVYSRKIQKLGDELDRLKAAYTNLKATNAEQAQTIKQITDNFFKVTGELNSELDSLKAANASLKAANAEQAQTIKQITDNYFKVTGRLNEEINSLEAIRDEQAATIKKLKGQRTLLGLGFLVATAVLVSCH
jgi:chromosome segregation ATPase